MKKWVIFWANIQKDLFKAGRAAFLWKKNQFWHVHIGQMPSLLAELKYRSEERSINVSSSSGSFCNCWKRAGRMEFSFFVCRLSCCGGKVFVPGRPDLDLQPDHLLPSSSCFTSHLLHHTDKSHLIEEQICYFSFHGWLIAGITELPVSSSLKQISQFTVSLVMGSRWAAL